VVELEPFVPSLRSSLRLEGGEAEHRQVTAAFVKFAGVEALLAQHGPAGIGEALDVLGAVVGRVTSELGLTWLESDIDVDGGKLYLAAGAPSTTGADEERMLRALRAIIDEGSPLTLRAGVHRGPAFAGDIGASTRRTYAVMGDTVNLAARLAARAEPGDPRYRRGARALADPLRDLAAAIPGQRQGASDHGLQRRCRHRCRGGGTSSRAADHRS
jgi:class 3 adenylate cyclase